MYDLAAQRPLATRPRDGEGTPIIHADTDLINCLERFVTAWGSTGQSEKALLLVHHWLDALACWSLEDLYLSATTLLQVIVATQNQLEGRLTREAELDFYPGVIAASTRANITQPSENFKNMRNELIHDGRLSGKRFKGRDVADPAHAEAAAEVRDRAGCAEVAAEVLNWFDSYIFSVFQLGHHEPRFKGRDFLSLNAYSI